MMATTTMDTHGTSPQQTAIVSNNKEEVLHFWSVFRNLCNSFHRKIDALLLLTLDDGASPDDSTPSRNLNDEMKNQVRCHYATTSKRNEGRLQLDSILKQVRLLQQHVLSSSGSMTTATTSRSSSSGNVVLDAMLSQSMPDLSLTDIRLISVEMENILNRFDEAREIICPKEKFVFRRYRRALEELNRNACKGEKGQGAVLEVFKTDAGTENVKKQQQEQQKLALGFSGVIENKSNCIIEVQSDGSLTLRDEVDPQEHWQVYSITRPYLASQSSGLASEQSAPPAGPSSYLLQNLTGVTVIFHPELQSLHMQNIHQCKIYSVVLGPVHVTNCHDSEIRCSAYQLRVHDSKNVKFGVWVRSGPIIEDCTDIVFAGDFYHAGGSDEPERRLDRNMYWDVKDFNWLRSLRKSPNFVIANDDEGVKNAYDDSKVSNVHDGCAHDDDAILVLEEEDSEDEI